MTDTPELSHKDLQDAIHVNNLMASNAVALLGELKDDIQEIKQALIPDGKRRMKEVEDKTQKNTIFSAQVAVLGSAAVVIIPVLVGLWFN